MSDWLEFVTASEALQEAMLTQTLQEIVAEVGPMYGFPFAQLHYCRYVAEGQPACLVGVVLHRLGMPVDELSEWDARDDSRINTIEPEGIAPSVLAMMQRAQDAQDNRGSWAYAMERALKP
jgi:hypothetical protein